MVFKDTILKAIHNLVNDRKEGSRLRMVFKDTILKAIHNRMLEVTPPIMAANGL